MTARLLVREVNAREFVTHVPDFEDEPETITHFSPPPNAGVQTIPAVSGVERATAEGERLCAEGNVEAFQVWTLACAKRRVWGLEDIA